MNQVLILYFTSSEEDGRWFCVVMQQGSEKPCISMQTNINTNDSKAYQTEVNDDNNSNKTYNTTDLGESFSKDMSGKRETAGELNSTQQSCKDLEVDRRPWPASDKDIKRPTLKAKKGTVNSLSTKSGKWPSLIILIKMDVLTMVLLLLT